MGHGRRRRAGRRSWDEIEAIVANYESSGLTQAGFARRHGIALGTLTNWLRRARARAAEEGGTEFIEVIAQPGAERHRDYDFELLFDEDREAARRVETGCAEPPRGRGLPVRALRIAAGFDGASLERVLGVLETFIGDNP